MKITKTENGTYNIEHGQSGIYEMTQTRLWDRLITAFKQRRYEYTRQMFRAMDKENRHQLINALCLAEYNPGLKDGELADLFDIIID